MKLIDEGYVKARGLREQYDSEKYEDIVYYCTDSHEILLNDIVYGTDPKSIQSLIERIQVLEEKEDKDTIYDDSEIRDRLDTIEGALREADKKFNEINSKVTTVYEDEVVVQDMYIEDAGESVDIYTREQIDEKLIQLSNKGSVICNIEDFDNVKFKSDIVYYINLNNKPYVQIWGENIIWSKEKNLSNVVKIELDDFFAREENDNTLYFIYYHNNPLFIYCKGTILWTDKDLGKKLFIAKTTEPNKTINLRLYTINNQIFKSVTSNENSVICYMLEEGEFNCYVGDSNIKRIYNMPIGKAYDIYTGCASCYNLEKVNFSNTDNPITSVYGLLEGCNKIEEVDLSKIDLSNATSFRATFKNCYKLKKVNFGKYKTIGVTWLGGLFEGCSSMETIDTSFIDATNTSNLSYMFQGCTSLKNLDLSKMETPVGSDFNHMFNKCTNLVSLSINLNLTKTTVNSRIKNMFTECDSLTNVYGNIQGIQISLSLADSSKLTQNSCMIFINGLVEATKQSLTFHADAYDRLSEEQLAVATTKGWSVVKA